MLALFVSLQNPKNTSHYILEMTFKKKNRESKLFSVFFLFHGKTGDSSKWLIRLWLVDVSRLKCFLVWRIENRFEFVFIRSFPFDGELFGICSWPIRLRCYCCYCGCNGLVAKCLRLLYMCVCVCNIKRNGKTWTRSRFFSSNNAPQINRVYMEYSSVLKCVPQNRH